MKKPKVFISYSWTSQQHQNKIREWAEQLLADGVDILFDIYDLKEGNDKYTYMEKMVNDPTVTHVLAFCDQKYKIKAESRESGVGTESQIISNEIYTKIDQSKFIPIVCEKDENENEYLPVFFKNLIWIDFSSPELANENWEKLIRLLYGKPFYEKPIIGKPPLYITQDTSIPSSPIKHKLNIFKQSLLNDRKSKSFQRKDFLDQVIIFADSLRIRERPNVANLGDKIIEDFHKLTNVRNLLIEWLQLELQITSSNELVEYLLPLLDRIRELKSRPKEINSWNEAWFDAHSLFINDLFLYIVTCLQKNKSYYILSEVFNNQYLIPETENTSRLFENYDCFYSYSQTLNQYLTDKDKVNYHSPSAEIFKRFADSEIISFSDLLEGELLILLVTYLRTGIHWSPQVLFYRSEGSRTKFFLMLSKKSEFEKFKIVINNFSSNLIKETIIERIRKQNFGFNTYHAAESIISGLNLDNLNTL